MIPPTVRVVDVAEEDPAIATIALAFAADPMARWTWPRACQYLEAIPRMARAFGGKAFSNGSAFCTEGYTGTALWLPPGVQPNEEELAAVIDSTVAPALAREAAPVFEQMAAYHPAEPHWFLPLIGVDPAWQGQGYGDALMACALAQCDRDHAPAYLESSNPRNSVLSAPRLRGAGRNPDRVVADPCADAAPLALDVGRSGREAEPPHAVAPKGFASSWVDALVASSLRPTAKLRW